ncbi:MAG: rhamnulokinase [Sphaerochaetaceae bacterium]|nr:rhamnulokinase [Sphaerochaetaceae bacterium]
MSKHIAIDLGASNGRVIVGDLDSFEVVHRFVTENVKLLHETYWDIPYIFAQIKTGIKAALDLYGDQITSIGVDTWGVDYLLFDSFGSPVSFAYHYRDSRTDERIEQITRVIDRETLFKRTGIAFQPFNTLYQLKAMKETRPQVLSTADRYLSVPDTITYWLTGVMSNEMTHASTTQLFNPTTKDWDYELIEKAGLPSSIFKKIVSSGTKVAPLESELARELNVRHRIDVVAVGTHDTASAVAAVPNKKGKDFLYISSGTWSLLGVESEEPIVTKEALDSGFTNEMAVNGNIRFLKNIMGMWIQQECVRYWESNGEKIEWKELDGQTIDCASYEGYIDPLDTVFLKPNSPGSLMVDRVKKGCTDKGFLPPESHGEIMVAIYRGLARAYRQSIDEIKKITGQTFDSIHVIGGGCKNEILNQWTADETGLQVVAGPVEATALGNLMVQMIATGELDGVQMGRNRIVETQKVKVFVPNRQ